MTSSRPLIADKRFRRPLRLFHHSNDTPEQSQPHLRHLSPTEHHQKILAPPLGLATENGKGGGLRERHQRRGRLFILPAQ